MRGRRRVYVKWEADVGVKGQWFLLSPVIIHSEDRINNYEKLKFEEFFN